MGFIPLARAAGMEVPRFTHEKTVITTALIILCLLFLSAFFSGSETGLTAITRARIHHLAKEGDKRAEQVIRVREHKEKLIGAILLGNNLVNIAASALATSLLIGLFGETGVFYATVIMTVLVLIFAEVLPKTYAFSHPETIALNVAPIFLVIVKVLSPITETIYFIVRQTMRLFGYDPGSYKEMVSASDLIRGTIEIQHQEGQMERDEKEMLGGVLDLGEITVEDIMEHRKQVFMIDADQKPPEAVAAILASNHSRIPLWRDNPDNIIGLLHVRDLTRAMGVEDRAPKDIDLTALAKEPWFIPETTSLRDQLFAFREKRLHFAFVVNEYGDFQGIVTLEDIIEEIVGQIEDEYDKGSQAAVPQADGSVLLDAMLSIRDVNREMDWDLPDEDASNLAGLLIHEAQTIPEEGEKYTFHGFEFTVTRKQENQILQLLMKPLADSEARDVPSAL